MFSKGCDTRYVYAPPMEIHRKTRMFSLSQHIVFAHFWSIQFVGLQFLPDSLPATNSIPLHETIVITWLIDLVFYDRPVFPLFTILLSIC